MSTILLQTKKSRSCLCGVIWGWGFMAPAKAMTGRGWGESAEFAFHGEQFGVGIGQKFANEVGDGGDFIHQPDSLTCHK